MAYKDIRSFIKVLEKNKQIKHITTEVDPVLEITEITDRVSKRHGEALLFHNVKGSEFPLLINTFGSTKRLNLALEVQSLDDIAARIRKLIDLKQYLPIPNAFKMVPDLLSMINVIPIKVKNAPAQEVIEKADLTKLPIMQCWPDDGGKFITLPLVFTKDPETGTQNVGMYRMQVYDKNTTGMHWHLHKDGREIYEKYKKIGKRMPVSVAIGCDPATIYAATAPLPKIIDEMMFAGFLRNSPVKLVKSVTNDIYVPANSEFVLEGYVEIGELRKEGPFGDHTGYYSLTDDYPVFHVKTITRRKNPIYMSTIVGKPPMEDCFLGKATERIFLPLLQLIAPEIIDMNFPLEGVFHNCVIVSIDKRYPLHAKKIMNTLWGYGQMMYTKMIIVVDKDVNPHDVSTVAWKVFNNIDAKRDLVLSEGVLDALDHASSTPHFGTRLGIDATKKWKTEGHDREWPDDIVMSNDIKQLVSKRWKSYGI